MNEIDEAILKYGQVGIIYLTFHQHGNVYKHIVQLLDATLQTDNVFVSGFNLIQGLFRNARVDNLWRGEGAFYNSQHIASEPK